MCFKLTKQQCLIFLVFLLISFVSFAENLALAPNAPMEYVVKQGDTLWSIAERFLQQPWKWRELWWSNPDIKDPDLIYPGDVLELFKHNGSYRLRRARHGTVKLYPSARAYPLQEAIPVIPFNDIKPFLRGVQVVSMKQLGGAGYVAALQDNLSMVGEGSRIFARAMHWPRRLFYSVFRARQVLENPFTHEVLGVKAINVAEARRLRPGDPSILRITQAFQETQVKDRVLPMPKRLKANDFYPKAPAHGIYGHILSIIGEASVAGQHDVVIIDKGKVNGIARGDVLAVFQRSQLLRDPFASKHHSNQGHHAHHRLVEPESEFFPIPSQRMGEMIIFRVFSRVSYGLVLHARNPIHLDDIVTNPF